MHVHFSFEHDTGRNDTSYRQLSTLAGNWELQRLLLDGWGLGKNIEWFPLIYCTLISFLLFQEFAKQRDQGAPVRDIFKSIFLGNLVSDRSIISLFIILYDWPRKIRRPRPLLASAVWGGEGESWVDWLPIVWLGFSAFFYFKLVKCVWSNHFGLTEN